MSPSVTHARTHTRRRNHTKSCSYHRSSDTVGDQKISFQLPRNGDIERPGVVLHGKHDGAFRFFSSFSFYINTEARSISRRQETSAKMLDSRSTPTLKGDSEAAIPDQNFVLILNPKRVCGNRQRISGQLPKRLRESISRKRFFVVFADVSPSKCCSMLMNR